MSDAHKTYCRATTITDEIAALLGDVGAHREHYERIKASTDTHIACTDIGSLRVDYGRRISVTVLVPKGALLEAYHQKIQALLSDYYRKNEELLSAVAELGKTE